MSVNTSIFCPRTMTSLWIGQGDIIYYGNKEVMELLTEFLHCNSCYPLYFLSEHMMSTVTVDLLPAISPSTEYGSCSSEVRVVKFEGEDSLQVVGADVYEYVENYLTSVYK